MAKTKRAPGYALSIQEFQRAARARRQPMTDAKAARLLCAREEWRDQAAVIEWADAWAELCWPELKYLNGSLNGVRLSPGAAAKAKRCGMRRGYPDLNLPVARGGFSGLYIELKSMAHGEDGRRPVLEPEQKEWRDFLRGQGYCAMACWGSSDAIMALTFYLDGKMVKEKEVQDADQERTGIVGDDGAGHGDGAGQPDVGRGDQELPGPELRPDAPGGGPQDQAETERPEG